MGVFQIKEKLDSAGHCHHRHHVSVGNINIFLLYNIDNNLMCIHKLILTLIPLSISFICRSLESFHTINVFCRRWKKYIINFFYINKTLISVIFYLFIFYYYWFVKLTCSLCVRTAIMEVKGMSTIVAARPAKLATPRYFQRSAMVKRMLRGDDHSILKLHTSWKISWLSTVKKLQSSPTE